MTLVGFADCQPSEAKFPDGVAPGPCRTSRQGYGFEFDSSRVQRIIAEDRLIIGAIDRDIGL